MKEYTEKDLIEFGKYLLSPERRRIFKMVRNHIPLDERLKMVTDADLKNFFYKEKVTFKFGR